MPLFYGTAGAETTEAGGKPSLEGITPKQVLAVVQLHDGVLQHPVARRLDRAGWKISEDQYAELMHAAQVSEGAERIIKSMNRQSAPPAAGMKSTAGDSTKMQNAPPAVDAVSTAGDRARSILDKKKLDVLELFGSEHGLGQELGRLGFSVFSESWNIDDLRTRQAVADLVVTVEPKA